MRYSIEIECDQNKGFVWCTFPTIKIIGNEKNALMMELPQAIETCKKLSERGIRHHLNVHKESAMGRSLI